MSTSTATFIYCLYNCLWLGGKTLPPSNASVAARQRALLSGSAVLGYPQLFLGNGRLYSEVSIPINHHADLQKLRAGPKHRTSIRPKILSHSIPCESCLAPIPSIGLSHHPHEDAPLEPT